MFDDATQTNNDQSAQPAPSAPALTPDMATPAMPATSSTPASAEPAIMPDPTMSSTPIADPATIAPAEPPMPSEPTFNTTPVSTDLSSATDTMNNSDTPSQDSMNPSSDLQDIKKQALQSLAPLVGKLDQSPEEKFRTTMMMIQASDDQSMLKDAFEAAQNISDDKMRAQALLDVINEVNYFSQKNKNTN